MAGFINKYGKLIFASLIVMAIGVIVIIISLPVYIYWNIDLDIIGFFIFIIGLAMLMIGIIRRQKPKGWRLAVMVAVVVLLLAWTVVPMVVSTIYYLVTGKPLGG